MVFFFSQGSCFKFLFSAGFPAGVIQIVNGTAPVVNALIDHPLVKCVAFVGSTKVNILFKQDLVLCLPT